MRSFAPLLLLASVAGTAFASPTHIRRSRTQPHAKKRDGVESQSSTSAATASGTQVGQLVAKDVAPQVVGVLGHWEVYTTSQFFRESALSVSRTRLTIGPAETTITAGISPTSSSASAPTTVTSSSWSDSNPITSFLSTATDNSLNIVSVADLSPALSSAATSTSPNFPAVTSTALNGSKHVFAHFMIGICSTYQQSDYEADMTLAKSKGIDGFALNIGVDPYTQAQLDLAYAAAAAVIFEVFISFDFNWYQVGETSGVATMLSRYVNSPAQLLVDGKPYVSSFIGDGFDWAGVASQVGRELYAVPFWQPSASNAANSGLEGQFSW